MCSKMIRVERSKSQDAIVFLGARDNDRKFDILKVINTQKIGIESPINKD